MVNAFGEHTAISAGGHHIAYMAPQDIQDDLDVRVVLCKDAISTGWDCPRAEVLVSLRRAQDYTYIAQLIGRMVRTPLARRIPSEQTLNDVHCYLPRFNKAQVEAIAARFKEGNNDEPPVDTITEPVRVWRNEAVPQELFGMLEALPTYVVPGKAYRTQVSRLHTLGTLLAGDHVVENAVDQVRDYLAGVLDAQRRRLESDGSFALTLKRIRSLKMERSYALLAAESLDDLPETAEYEMDLDDNNVDDLYRVAKRKLPEGVAQHYWDKSVREQSTEDYDPTEAKAIVAALALHAEVVEAVESAAEQQVRSWLKEHQRSISALPDARKVAYEPVKREARDSELTDFVVPTTMVLQKAEMRRRHLLANEAGDYPAAVKGWEIKVLEEELKDPELLGWYRNPTGGPSALRVPYQGDQHDRAMYPDFVMFHTTDEGIKPSIVDPHGYHLGDALAKLRGLAAYAAAHGDTFARIDAVIEDKSKQLLALDLKSEAIRDAVHNHDGEVLTLFQQQAGNYT